MATKLSEELKLSAKASTDEIQTSLETQKTEMTGMATNVAKNISDSMILMESTIQDHLKSLDGLGDDMKSTTKNSLVSLNERLEEQIVAVNNNMQEVQKEAIQSMGSSLTSLSQKFVDDYTPLTEKLKETVRIAKNIDIDNET